MEYNNMVLETIQVGTEEERIQAAKEGLFVEELAKDSLPTVRIQALRSGT